MKFICGVCENIMSVKDVVDQGIPAMTKLKCTCCSRERVVPFTKAYEFYKQYKDVDISFIETVDLEKEFMKFNIPGDDKSFSTGNGEGMCGLPLTEEDRAKMKDNNYYGIATVISLNNSVYYEDCVNYGNILDVRCRGEKRAVITEDFYKFINNDFKIM